MVIYDAPGFLQVTYEDYKGYITFRWEKFGISFEKAKAAHMAAFETAKAKNCMYYLAETSHAMGTLLQPVVDWFVNEWMPVLTKGGLVAVLTVVPQTSVLAKLSTKDWQNVKATGIIMENVDSVSAAEAAFTEIKATR